MTFPPAPDWLARHDGFLRRGLTDETAFVLVSGQPRYRLEVRPAGGRHTCAVIEANNGRLLPDASIYPSPEAALAGGLEQLRNHLGW
jgi:hypothetical protein